MAWLPQVYKALACVASFFLLQSVRMSVYGALGVSQMGLLGRA